MPQREQLWAGDFESQMTRRAFHAAQRLCVAGFGVLLFIVSMSQLQLAGQTALKIVILEGEGAVNIIQQKTATAPVIEVRDQNDLPVAGAAVRFGIRSGRGRVQRRPLVVRDHRRGRSGGRHWIRADRQRRTADHRRRDVSGAGGRGHDRANHRHAGGGGLSTTTIGVIAGAVAGGAIVAKELGSESGATYKGNYSGNVNTAFIPSMSFCSRTMANAGTVEMFDIEVGSDGRVSGAGSVEGTTQMVSSQAQASARSPPTYNPTAAALRICRCRG